MAQVAQATIVHRPVGAVFAYMDTPENQPEITPSMQEVRNIERLNNGGIRAEYTYKMAGIALNGSVEAQEYRPQEAIHFRVSGAIEGHIRWRFEPLGEKATRVYYEADYALPNPVLDRVAAPFIEAYNRQEVAATLQNLKVRLEGEASG